MTVHRLARLSLISILIALLLSAPIWVMLGQIFVDTRSIWQHLWQTVLLDYVTNSLLLMFGVGVGVLLLGVSTAWLTSCCEFPFRRSLTLLLLLPMAMPAYIIAYTYTGLLDFAGPVQSWIRAVTGLAYGQYWFPPIRSLTGAMLMLALVLYPYVYLLARAAFLAQSSTLLDVSRTLGLSAWQSFYRVTLPMARPAIIAGLSLALMETLADYGTVQFFGVTTFTTGIFRTFYGFGDAAAAAQLSLLLLSFVVVLVALEKYSRRRIGYYAAANYRPIQRRMPIQGWRALLVIGICFGPALLGFILPAALLLTWSLSSAQWFDTAFLTLIWHSFSL
ncbi:MAG: ABC transporter permease subunit, partial [Reinekea forsetii]|nr:ABC transporter permease subunit [Reinekea forsetii]